MKIVGTGSCLPQRVVSNDDLAAIMDTSDEWISSRTGIRNRHIATTETTTSLACDAVKSALQDAGDLMALLQLADVQLDTYPYGGWTTNLEALYYGLPVVTQQGNLARSRWGAGLLSAMGISEGIAQNEREFVDWAVRFALEPRLRAQVSQKIEERAPKVLFDGEAAQPAYEAALVRMILAKEKKLQREVNA